MLKIKDTIMQNPKQKAPSQSIPIIKINKAIENYLASISIYCRIFQYKVNLAQKSHTSAQKHNFYQRF